MDTNDAGVQQFEGICLDRVGTPELSGSGKAVGSARILYEGWPGQIAGTGYLHEFGRDRRGRREFRVSGWNRGGCPPLQGAAVATRDKWAARQLRSSEKQL